MEQAAISVPLSLLLLFKFLVLELVLMLQVRTRFNCIRSGLFEGTWAWRGGGGAGGLGGWGKVAESARD